MDRIIDHEGLRVDVLQQMGRRDVGHVKGRILAHQDHIHVTQIHRVGILRLKMISGHIMQADPAHGRAHPPPVKGQIPRAIMMKRMTAQLRLDAQPKGGVADDIDGLQGIHLKGNGQTHGRFLPAPARPSTAWASMGAAQLRRRFTVSKVPRAFWRNGSLGAYCAALRSVSSARAR